MNKSADEAFRKAIESEVYDAIRYFGHPQATDTVGDAVSAIFAAAEEWVEGSLNER